MDILNSSGQKLGEVRIEDNVIIIDNNNKPLLIIEDEKSLFISFIALK